MRTMVRHFCVAALALAVGGIQPSLAQSDDDILDDILSEDPGASDGTVRDEREALEDEADRGADEEPETQLVPVKRRVIKILQPKSFMKIGRFEAEPYVGFVTNDPFIRRYLFGANILYHPTEIFGIELSGAFSPDFGDADKKPITQQITEENQVTPDISKIMWYLTLDLTFSPIFGKIAVIDRTTINFDVFGTFGTGVVFTVDDLEVLQKNGDEFAELAKSQIHPALTFGGGLRIIFSQAFALRFEGRGLSYIEVIEGTTLELKNNVTLLLGASVFFPGMK